MKKLVLPGIVFLSITALSLFIGLSDTPDSFQYFALGKYIYFKELLPQAPFNYDRPRTLFGPLYALFVTPLYQLPAPLGAFLIPFIQLALLTLSAFFIYKAVEHIFRKPWPLVTAIVFILLPFNLVYATFMMSETLTQFFVALFIFTMSRYRGRASGTVLPWLTLVGALATLTRFGYIVLCIGPLIAWIYISIKTRTGGKILAWLPACIGVGLIALWVLFNWRTNGAWTLSTYSGRHLYDSVVTDGKLLPDSHDLAMAPFLQNGHSPGEMITMPWWEVQSWFIGSGKNDAQVDRIFLALSLAAVRRHPVAYIAQTIRRMMYIPTTEPYLRENFVRDFAGCGYAFCQNCKPTPWNNYTCWNKPICTPPVVSCTAQSRWAGFVNTQNLLYPIGAAILFIIAVIGSILALGARHPLLRWTAGIFIILLGFHAAAEFVQGRFIIPMYPLYAVLLVYPLSLPGAKRYRAS